MAAHDQRFKTLLKEFLAELLALFFPKWAAALDFSRVDWLDKELLPDPPSGQGFYADLVARIGSREDRPGPASRGKAQRQRAGTPGDRGRGSRHGRAWPRLRLPQIPA